MATKFTPLHDRILVRGVEEADTTRGGIIIPDSAKDKPMEGEVISAGKGKISEEGRPHPVAGLPCSRFRMGSFPGAPAKNKTYPLRLILESVSTFNLGYSTTETQRLLHTRFHRSIPERTISSWLAEYRPLATYARLRTDGTKLFARDTIIRTVNFDHQQVYRHQIHRAKLKIL